MAAPTIYTQIDEARNWVRAQTAQGRSVGLVPTMGALHEGHLSLARRARQECDRVVVSVFVNPTQFAPGEDFQNYPRDPERDAVLLATGGVDAIFSPAVEVMYPEGMETTIDVGSVALPWEGASRPTHFAGVATVVAKLFAILPAGRAYFGQKDYQQTVVIRRMVEDLNLPIELVICPIVREPDGLAMSSRNAYLSPEQRQQALAISRGLRAAEHLHAEGERDPQALCSVVQKQLEQTTGVEPEYVALLEEGTVTEPSTIEGPVVLAVAARVGQTRLLDNVLLT